MAAYLLGMGDMPPLCHQDFTVTMANHFLHNQNQGYYHAAGAEGVNNDENIIATSPRTLPKTDVYTKHGRTQKKNGLVFCR